MSQEKTNNITKTDWYKNKILNQLDTKVSGRNEQRGAWKCKSWTIYTTKHLQIL